VITAAFLDRDGTINVKADEGDYIKQPAELVLLPGAAEAIRRLNDAGIKVIVVTNQRGIACRVMTESDFQAVTVALNQELAAVGAHIDATFHCPHDNNACDCRKPKPGLILKAFKCDETINASSSILIGDAPSDMEAAQRAGLALALRISNASSNAAQNTFPCLADAVDFALRSEVG
jgi:D-glycero-D-manno-heptose 1,7-bisphosphate phosphatase